MLNIDNIQQGETISIDRCSDHLHMDQKHRHFKLEVLRLRGQIERSLLRRTGRRLVVVAREDGIRVLSDSEAATYCPKAGDSARRRMRRSHRSMRDVDERNLTDDEKKQYITELVRSARYVQALNEASLNVPRKKNLRERLEGA